MGAYLNFFNGFEYGACAMARELIENRKYVAVYENKKNRVCQYVLYLYGIAGLVGVESCHKGTVWSIILV